MADYDEGDIPKEVPASEDFEGERENIIRGHKASMANPSTAFWAILLQCSGMY